MKKFLFGGLGLLSLLFLMVLTACGGAKAPEAKDAAKTSLKVAMVTDTGGVNDQSFNQSAWEGLQKAEKELGVKVSYKESKQAADYATNLENLKDAKIDLIWGIGFLMGDAILEKAKVYPQQKFAIIDYDYGDKTPANVVGVTFKAEQPSYLVGYVAAKMSKTGKVGFIGGIRGAVIDQFEYGYRAGVKAANPKVEVIIQYAESFSDSAKGKSIATSMYQQGVDVIFSAAGAVGNGAIEAAKEQNKWAIGVDRDQNYLAPQNVITSALKLVNSGIFNLSKTLVDGKFTGGKAVSYGLAEGGVGVAKTGGLVSPEIWAEVDKLQADIIAGKIVVPFNQATFEGK